MNLPTKRMRETQDKQRDEKMDLIEKWEDKLKFSIVSIVFFLVLTIYTSIILSHIIYIPITTGLITLIFVQQIIRSYNYLEFHKSNYHFMESAYESIAKITNKK